MRRQPPAAAPAYHIFNLGFSAWGRKLSATACVHKATKSALSALTEALAEDLKSSGMSRDAVCHRCDGLTDMGFVPIKCVLTSNIKHHQIFAHLQHEKTNKKPHVFCACRRDVGWGSQSVARDGAN